MRDLPASFIKNPRYISEYSKAISMLESNCQVDIDESSFVALYQYSGQVDKIIFTESQVIVVGEARMLSLQLENIEKSRHCSLNLEECRKTDFAKTPDAICITMKNGEQHVIEVMGHTKRVRDAFSMSKLIAILKRRSVARVNMSPD